MRVLVGIGSVLVGLSVLVSGCVLKCVVVFVLCCYCYVVVVIV